ncbi:MAG: hypothetical protein Edafosvirus16_19 [Edafosvirus sp.]|uniref:M7GpppX diphosphatase n=1 Tax=Edafosvirus sp. TaxID=2487765 RepID=A0A3G4ZUE3_9VIRU|nr:MAG: hypothetical protein Edafosvirus16_19 [Edafosvirus sp.]
MAKLDPEKPVHLNITCLAVQPFQMDEVKLGYAHVFPKVIIVGKNSSQKQNFLKLITGLYDTDLLFSRNLELSFHKSNEPNEYVKMGGFGGNTYKLKNLNKRIVDENKDVIYKPFKIQIYSKKIQREYTLVILPDENTLNKYHESCVIINKYDESFIVVNTSEETDYAKIISEHESKSHIEQIPEIKDSKESTESYEFYLENVLRFAQRQDKTRFFDIINKKTDEELFYDCPDFVLIRDMLWADKDVNNMHYIIIFKNPKYMSIRDLSQSDIELLNTALTIGKIHIGKLCDVSKIKMETYFHYHPSVWQLHIHFVSSTIEEKHKKFMVDDVINNLNKDTDYYKKNDIVM